MESRRPSRLEGFDYSKDGSYYITLFVKQGCMMLWSLESVWAISNRPKQDEPLPQDFPVLSQYGKATEKYIKEIAAHYPGAKVREYVIMPNHVHMIIRLECPKDSSGRLLIVPTSVPTIIQQLKQAITKSVKTSLWAKGYIDRVIRNEKEEALLTEYIKNDPNNWLSDDMRPVIKPEKEYRWLKMLSE